MKEFENIKGFYDNAMKLKNYVRYSAHRGEIINFTNSDYLTMEWLLKLARKELEKQYNRSAESDQKIRVEEKEYMNKYYDGELTFLECASHMGSIAKSKKDSAEVKSNNVCDVCGSKKESFYSNNLKQYMCQDCWDDYGEACYNGLA
jgi:ribosomal protein S14